MGWAHSIEAWEGERLVGGLYGVAVDGLFAGESMFARARDASKVALVALVELLRAAVAKEKTLEERIKWGHLVYFANGPVLLIRAEESGLLFGFWRGKRLTGIEPRLKGGGKYEMATLELHEGDAIKPAVARRLERSRNNGY